MEKPKLYYFPIVHTLEEMGQSQANTSGFTTNNDTTQLWRAISVYVDSLKLDYGKTKIYQDGLPLNTPQHQFIEETQFEPNTPNFVLIKRLCSRGAVLVGTEDPQLIHAILKLRENHLQAQKAAKKKELKRMDQDYERLMTLRDRFIGKQISQTLKYDETGLLFIGEAHKPKPYIVGIDIITPPEIESLTVNMTSPAYI